jgi:hypothetical protein
VDDRVGDRGVLDQFLLATFRAEVAAGGQTLGPTTHNATKPASIQAGTVMRPSGPVSGLQGRVIVMAAMATDDSSKARPGRLVVGPGGAQDGHNGLIYTSETLKPTELVEIPNRQGVVSRDAVFSSPSPTVTIAV